MKYHGGTVNVSYKLLIVRDAAKKGAIDAALPSDWRVLAVGDEIKPGIQGPFEVIICGCEMYSQDDWTWYHTVVKNLRTKSNPKDPLWTN